MMEPKQVDKKLFDELFRLVGEWRVQQDELQKTHALFIVPGQGFVWLRKDQIID